MERYYFLNLIDKKSIIGSRIEVKEGNSGRLQVIVAVREVSRIDSNLLIRYSNLQRMLKARSTNLDIQF